MQKKDRHKTLLRLIDSQRVSNQSELVTSLSDAGYLVTQASVSRDLDELGIVKINGHYALPEIPVDDAGFGSVMFAIAGGNLIVGRCQSGMASALTVRIDAATVPEIVGTIAGDDTIFIAVRNPNEQAAVIKQLTDLFG